MDFPDAHWMRIYCVFKDKTLPDAEITKEEYEIIRNMSFRDDVRLHDRQGRILFDWKRWEIIRFTHMYPRDASKDEYMMNSQIYQREKAKRNEFWNENFKKMTQDQKDEVWSIIYARWGKTYKLGHTERWKRYFATMFPIIALELMGYKDKLSSQIGWVINTWAQNLEIPDMFGDINLFRNAMSKM